MLVPDEGSGLQLTALIQACVILFIGALIIISNILVISTLLTMQGCNDVMNHYMLSLAVADLMCGVFLVPLSVYPAIVHQWVYGDIVCRLAGYLSAALWSVSVYTFMWIGVDRYIAVRKPVRYEVVQTATRCQCWVVFTWVTAGALCCPPLLGVSRPYYEHTTFVCLLEWGGMTAYSLTMATLVLAPSISTILYTYSYIFYAMKRLRSCIHHGDKEYASALSENLAHPNHAMSFVLVLTFWISWLPWIGLKAYQTFWYRDMHVPWVNFILFWMGILNSFWKFLIYIIMSPSFRAGLGHFLLSLICRSRVIQTEDS